MPEAITSLPSESVPTASPPLVAPANLDDDSVRIKGFAAGTASGLTKLLVGQPFDLVKVRMQCSVPGQFTGPLDVLLQTVRKEGLRALYKGAAAPAIGWGISDPVLLGSLHNYRLMFARMEARKRGEDVALRQAEAKAKGEQVAEIGDERLSLVYHGLAGTMAGITVSFIATPVEVIKAKLQMQIPPAPRLYTGPIDVVKQVVRANGVLGMYRGLWATILFRSWFGAMFLSYEVMMRAFRSVPEGSRYKLSEGASTFIAGGMGSNIFWMGSFPFDAVKNRLMADSITAPRYANWRGAAQQIWSEGGVRAVYRGFVPCMLRAFPTNASALLVWETTMKLLGAEELKK